MTDDLITCLFPGCGVKVKSIGPHIKCHKIKLAEYKDRFRLPDGSEPPTGWTVQNAAKTPQTVSKAPPKPSKPPSKDRHLTDEEEESFDERYKILFTQADEDPALSSSIREIVLNEISIARFQNQIAEYSSPEQVRLNPAVLETVAALAKMSKELQASNLALMKSLSLTREAKKASKQSVQTTPSKLVSSLEMFAANNSPDAVRRINEDMAESASRARRNLDQLSKELQIEENDDGEPDEDMVPASL